METLGSKQIGVWVQAPGTILRRSGVISPENVLDCYMQAFKTLSHYRASVWNTHNTKCEMVKLIQLKRWQQKLTIVLVYEAC